jgi:LysR family glycine cleavage system transcriptional activator
MIAQRELVEDDLRSGRVVTPIPLPLRMAGGYYLTYTPDRAPSARLLAFEAWVVGAAAMAV